ncbi:MAG: CsgG/HfaB family protein, partial [Methanococcaceae archaeon]
MIKKTILILVLALSFLHAEDTKKITVAVLYFDNNSIVDKEKLEPLSKGIAQMLITELAQIKSFKVVERERLNDLIKEQKLSLSGAVDQATIQKVGKLLGAQTLLFGSYVNFFGGKMRLDLRIVETETGLTLKAEEVTDDVEELFSMIKSISEKIA